MDWKQFRRFSRLSYWIGIAYIFAVILGVIALDSMRLDLQAYRTLAALLFFGIFAFIGAGFIIPGIGGLKYGVLTIRWFLASPMTVTVMPENVKGNPAKIGSLIVILIGLGVLVVGVYFLFGALTMPV